ncbi:response regulator, partial [Escherichia coli]|uniref:response regulator n=1 Tax=Escherichia coli TaxID=562 RepID=UPI0028DEC903
EDEAETTAHVSESLREAGWIVDAAVDGEDGLERASRGEHDVIIVDRMLPRRDGLSLVGELRARRVHTPVLFLTAMGSIADRVAGLEGGG